ncbi:hypothetical protein HRG84_19095 [Flavisolibacter sp. BT320]|nr:hypothetical protein [Flavisolibacter longurius]
MFTWSHLPLVGKVTFSSRLFFLFYLRAPVTNSNYEKLSKAIWYNGLQKRVHHRYKTSLYKKVKGTEWTKDDIELLEFSLAWYEVYTFCQLLVAAGHIDPGCGVPVIVQEYNSGTACKGIQFYGKEEDTLKVLFKEKEQE